MDPERQTFLSGKFLCLKICSPETFHFFCLCCFGHIVILSLQSCTIGHSVMAKCSFRMCYQYIYLLALYSSPQCVIPLPLIPLPLPSSNTSGADSSPFLLEFPLWAFLTKGYLSGNLMMRLTYCSILKKRGGMDHCQFRLFS